MFIIDHKCKSLTKKCKLLTYKTQNKALSTIGDICDEANIDAEAKIYIID